MEQNSNTTWVEGAMGAVKAITFICDVITYPVYLLLQRPWENRRQSTKPKVSVIRANFLLCFVFVVAWRVPKSRQNVDG